MSEGYTLSRRLLEAAVEARKQRQQHIKFSETFAPQSIAEWNAAVDRWHQDPLTAPDPYQDEEASRFLLTIYHNRMMRDLGQ